MKLSKLTLSLIFIWSIFMGITVGAIGFGAIFPSTNRLAKPLVCPHGDMQLETQTYTPTPVETVTTLTWYCVDPSTGEKTEIGLFPMSLYTGVFYGLILFALIYFGIKIWGKPLGKTFSSAPPTPIKRTSAPTPHFGEISAGAGNALRRMKELQQLRDANLISESEYEQKRAEVLKEL
ncbi:MAG: hypothetical protein DCC56_02955 [Anaerolineae bacterium]|nr:MAG: hypothetical protein DCC56_02955 [Anaerolineae bacterium]WKZ44204.1 MAG: SHOCT domain-containing protein [Anaerolineales bacterium]